MKKQISLFTATFLPLFLFLNWPGRLSFDPLQQLGYARAASYSDNHPIVMALLWKPLDEIWPGQAGMLVLFGGAWSLGLILLNRRQPRPWILLAAMVPPVFFNMGTIWKDVGLVSFFVLSVALIEDGRRKHLALVLAPLFLTFSFRHNAVFAFLPLCLWWGWVILRGFSSPIRALGAALGGACLILGFLFLGSTIHKTIKAQEANLWVQVPAYDLVGTSVMADVSLVPEEFKGTFPDLTVPTLKRYYTDKAIDDMMYRIDPKVVFGLPGPEDARARLARAWLVAISAEPVAYLRHRWNVFSNHLGMKTTVYYPFHSGIDPNSMGISTNLPSQHKTLLLINSKLRDTPIYRIWVYALLSILSAIYVLRSLGYAALPAWLVVSFSSGWLYLAGNFFVIPAADLRYSLLSLQLFSFVIFFAIDHAWARRTTIGNQVPGTGVAKEGAMEGQSGTIRRIKELGV